MLIWLLLIGFAPTLVYGLATQNSKAKVDLRIATFGIDISVYDLRLDYNSFYIYKNHHKNHKNHKNHHVRIIMGTVLLIHFIRTRSKNVITTWQNVEK